ncbi:MULTISPECIES: hypothetical protein [unclassified Bradyrhizobium]|uniref:hypothetical protein n=1 Tax=unclassified Bradyrhizobium TaxID=2631580 RepID=UPI0024794741|nr:MULTISPECIES: hypothetical protein [unclassified Bradyrhizobium]WGS19656.1 hypothetical protein MTX22_35740 [Bradyrhizobium sp. ISRA463]WGS26498.1 hypothetical protein MTX19_33195 [Bradyrhizobium sp. ISRA464]
MGYDAAVNDLDVSNSNSPNHVDPTNPVTSVHARVVAELGFDGSLHRTKVNVYSGDNGRGAIRANKVNGTPADQYFMVGNAGNGSGTQPVLIVDDTGVQLATPGSDGSDTVVGVQQGTPGSKNGFQFGFAVGQLGFAADKSGKDDNFRGLAIFNNTLYVTKGSGSNGINTVYQVGASGVLPTRDTASSTAFSILPGFPSNPSVNSGANGFYPFGLWFADANTLYVAQEGDGKLTDAATSPTAGLQKWIYANGTWSLAYTLQKGLNLGTAYHVKRLSDRPGNRRSAQHHRPREPRRHHDDLRRDVDREQFGRARSRSESGGRHYGQGRCDDASGERSFRCRRAAGFRNGLPRRVVRSRQLRWRLWPDEGQWPRPRQRRELTGRRLRSNQDRRGSLIVRSDRNLCWPRIALQAG